MKIKIDNSINLQNIRKGMIIKNYKELCNLLSLPILTGNSKKSQIKEIETFVKFSKEGNSFMIDDVYSSPILKNDNRTFSRPQSIYVNNFSIQLLHHLASIRKTNGSNFEFMTGNEIFRLTGMVNKNYRATRTAVMDYLEEKNYSMTVFDVDEFLLRTNNKMRDITRTSLNSLSNRFIILYNKAHCIGKDLSSRRIATPSEEGEIMAVKKEIINKINKEIYFGEEIIRDEKDIYLRRKSEHFYYEFTKKIYEKFGWDGVYSGWNITFHGSQIESNVASYEKEAKEILENKNLLNSKLVTFLNKNAKEKYDKYVDHVWGEIKNPLYEEDFVNSQKILTNIFIKLK